MLLSMITNQKKIYYPRTTSMMMKNKISIMKQTLKPQIHQLNVNQISKQSIMTMTSMMKYQMNQNHKYKIYQKNLKNLFHRQYQTLSLMQFITKLNVYFIVYIICITLCMQYTVYSILELILISINLCIYVYILRTMYCVSYSILQDIVFGYYCVCVLILIIYKD